MHPHPYRCDSPSRQTRAHRPICRGGATFLVVLLFLLLVFSPGVLRAQKPGDRWRDTGLDTGFVREHLSDAHCSQGDRSFLACIGAAQRVLDTHGYDLHLIPAAEVPDWGRSPRVVRSFGAATLVEDPGLRVGAEGNALEAVRTRTHRILRWRDRLGTRLRGRVDFEALRAWLEEEIIDPAQAERYAAAAINGYLAVSDAHGRIAPSSSVARGGAERRDEAPQGGGNGRLYTGIGAAVQTLVDAALITSVVRGGPAERAGLQVHDFILAVDGEPVAGLPVEGLIERLRGKDGSRVELDIKRQDERRSIRVRRGPVTVSNVTAHGLIDRGWQVAYLRIGSFLPRDTCSEVRRELDRQLKPTLNGLVLDLRDNPGGLVDQAVCVADLLLAKDRVVLEVRNVQDMSKSERIRTRENARVRVPMVTLVNAVTGSASELLAGALQDHGRSLVVGELTFGKGTVQTVRRWKGGRSVLEFYTAARYYRPSGTGVQLAGIEPDLPVPPIPDKTAQPRVVLREGDLFPTALPREAEVWNPPDPKRSAQIRECTIREGLAARRLRREAEMGKPTDYPLAVARDALVCMLTHRPP